MQRLVFLGAALLVLGACSGPIFVDPDANGDAATEGDTTGGDTAGTQGDTTGGDITTGTETTGGATGGTTGEETNCETDFDCDDGKWCNGDETCAPNSLFSGLDGCVAGVAPKPFDPDPTDCQIVGECDEETDMFPVIELSDGAPCDDGIACTQDDVCASGGICMGAPLDPACDDGLFCTGAEQCNTVLGCLPGAEPEFVDESPGDCLVPGPCEEETQSAIMVPAEIGIPCNDDFPCTNMDTCTGAGTCEGTPLDTLCDDGEWCNGVETCVVGAGCTEGTAPDAVDPDELDCLVPGACDEDSDSYTLVPAAAGVGCTDAFDCTIDDACDNAGACGGTPVDVACQDDLWCNGPEVCDPATGCGDGVAPAIPVDDNADDCMGDWSCDEGADMVVQAQKPTGTLCDDGVDCTLNDICDDSAGCAGTATDLECDDALFCSGTETCDAALGCQPGTPPVAVDDNLDDCLVPDICQEESDSFPLISAADAAPCSDGVACTLGDACDNNGACVPGTATNTECDDGLFCTGVETCDAALDCQPGAEPVPDNPCLVKTGCDEDGDLIGTDPASSGTACNDNVDCTVDDQCNDSGECVAGTPTDAECDNGQFCDGEETCDAQLGCQTGTEPEPAGVCVVKTGCDEEGDVVLSAQADPTTPCDDGVDCTTSDVCDGGGQCSGETEDNLCADTSPCTVDSCDPAGCLNVPVDCSTELPASSCEAGLRRTWSGGSCNEANGACEGFVSSDDACAGETYCVDGTCTGALPHCEITFEDGSCPSTATVCGADMTGGSCEQPLAGCSDVDKAASLVESTLTLTFEGPVISLGMTVFPEGDLADEVAVTFFDDDGQQLGATETVAGICGLEGAQLNFYREFNAAPMRRLTVTREDGAAGYIDSISVNAIPE